MTSPEDDEHESQNTTPPGADDSDQAKRESASSAAAASDEPADGKAQHDNPDHPDEREEERARLALERRLGLAESSKAAKMVLEAQDAYDAGNYRRVREIADALIEDSDASVARAGLALKTKVDVDPVQIVFLAACLAAFLFTLYEFF